MMRTREAPEEEARLDKTEEEERKMAERRAIYQGSKGPMKRKEARKEEK